MQGLPHVLNLVDPESPSSNRPNPLPRDDLQETDEQTPITEVGEQVVDMETRLCVYGEWSKG